MFYLLRVSTWLQSHLLVSDDAARDVITDLKGVSKHIPDGFYTASRRNPKPFGWCVCLTCMKPANLYLANIIDHNKILIGNRYLTVGIKRIVVYLCCRSIKPTAIRSWQPIHPSSLHHIPGLPPFIRRQRYHQHWNPILHCTRYTNLLWNLCTLTFIPHQHKRRRSGLHHQTDGW